MSPIPVAIHPKWHLAIERGVSVVASVMASGGRTHADVFAASSTALGGDVAVASVRWTVAGRRGSRVFTDGRRRRPPSWEGRAVFWSRRRSAPRRQRHRHRTGPATLISFPTRWILTARTRSCSFLFVFGWELWTWQIIRSKQSTKMSRLICERKTMGPLMVALIKQRTVFRSRLSNPYPSGKLTLVLYEILLLICNKQNHWLKINFLTKTQLIHPYSSNHNVPALVRLICNLFPIPHLYFLSDK